MGDGGTGEVLRVFGCKQPTTVSCNLENAPFVSDGSSYLMKKKNYIGNIIIHITLGCFYLFSYFIRNTCFVRNNSLFTK